VSRKGDFRPLKALLPERERRFKFSYDGYQDGAELVILVPPHWDGQVPPSVTLVLPKGAWQKGGKLPDAVLSKKLLKLAEKASGLQLAFSKPWKQDGTEKPPARPVSVTRASFHQVHLLLPAFAEA